MGYPSHNRLIIKLLSFMLTLEPRKLAEATIPFGTSWLLASCMEAKGKQDLWISQKPEALRVLREQAIPKTRRADDSKCAQETSRDGAGRIVGGRRRMEEAG
jgi:hypothetical protein